MKFGYYIKSLRKSKNLTLKELSKNLMSISFLSKFERDETDITFSHLLDLLNRLNMNFDEFMFMTKYSFSYKELLQEINKAYLNNNILALKYLYKQECELYEENKLYAHFLNSIMIKAIIHDIDATFSSITSEEATAISDFFMSIDYFGDYEISLFGNSLRCLEHNIIMLIMSEMHKKLDILSLGDDIRIKMIHITLNIATLAYEKNKNEDMKYALGLAKSLIDKRQLYFEINKLNFLKGIYEFSYGNKKIGEELLDSAIKVMDFLEDDINKQNHLMYLYEKINYSPI